MRKFIPYEKLGKKAKKKLNEAKRGSWQGVNPVTRRTENKKAYNRKKIGPENEADYFFAAFLF